MKNIFKSIITIFVVGFLIGCSSAPRQQPAPDYSNAPVSADKKYSSTPNYINTPERAYKRTTIESLSKDAKLQQEAGSLWVMQGQGSYLFAQNNLRLLGDLVSVDIDGEPKKELESKVETIANLLKRLEQRRIDFEQKQADQRLAMMKEREEKNRAVDGRTPASKDAKKVKKEEVAKNELDNFKFDIKKVPTRIREKLFNGNYRVEGSKGFMIGDKEYRVIINGIARAEDIMGDQVNSSKLIEANFDIVSTLRKGKQL